MKREDMHKKLLKSVAIVGLASTAFGTAQPVGAVVNGKYHELYIAAKKDLETITGGEIDFRHLERQTQLLMDIQSLANYLLGRKEFDFPEYKQLREAFSKKISGYDIYLRRLKVNDNYLNMFESEERSKHVEEAQVAKLNREQFNRICKVFKEAIDEFKVGVEKLQKENIELFRFPLYMFDRTHNGKLLAYSFIGDSYYEHFYTYDQDYDKDGLESYSKKVRKILWFRHLIKEIIVKGEEYSEELESWLISSLITSVKQSKVTPKYEYKKLFDELILSEEIPNIKSADEMINTLGGLLYDYYELKGNETELAKYKEYQEAPKRIEQEKFEETQEERLKTNKVLSINPLTNPGNILTVTTQTSNRIIEPIKQKETVHTFTLSGRSNGKPLSSLKGYKSTEVKNIIDGYNISDLSRTYGESNLLYVQLIGGSNTNLLVRAKGGKSEKVVSVNTNLSGMSDQNSNTLPGLSGRREVDGVIEETEEINKNVVPLAQTAQTEEKAPVIKVIENQFDTYCKNEANRIMTEYTEMRNSLHFYDWDAKVAELVQKGNVKFKEIGDALSNSKKVTEQELIFATDRLNVLCSNLQRRKEELSDQELNKLHDTVSAYNDAYNTLYSKAYYLDKQYYDEYHKASGEGRAITQYFDRLLSEGKIDYTNILESESVKTDLARLEGFTTTLTKLAESITQK